jgi:hypothetical protein
MSHARVRPVRWRPVAATAIMIATLVATAGDNVALPRPAFVLWAWERPEDLRFAGPDFGAAVLAGSIVLPTRARSALLADESARHQEIPVTRHARPDIEPSRIPKDDRTTRPLVG